MFFSWKCEKILTWLVVNLPLWKIWVRQMGVLSPIYRKQIIIMSETTNQLQYDFPTYKATFQWGFPQNRHVWFSWIDCNDVKYANHWEASVIPTLRGSAYGFIWYLRTQGLCQSTEGPVFADRSKPSPSNKGMRYCKLTMQQPIPRIACTTK